MVDPARLQVEWTGGAAELQPRAMQVLVRLARAPGVVVSRGALIEDCWRARAVSDDSINRVIHLLRRLASQGGEQGFSIETVAKVGYRLMVADAEAAPPDEPLPGRAAVRQPDRRRRARLLRRRTFRRNSLYCCQNHQPQGDRPLLQLLVARPRQVADSRPRAVGRHACARRGRCAAAASGCASPPSSWRATSRRRCGPTASTASWPMCSPFRTRSPARSPRRSTPPSCHGGHGRPSNPKPTPSTCARETRRRVVRPRSRPAGAGGRTRPGFRGGLGSPRLFAGDVDPVGNGRRRLRRPATAGAGGLRDRAAPGPERRDRLPRYGDDRADLRKVRGAPRPGRQGPRGRAQRSGGPHPRLWHEGHRRPPGGGLDLHRTRLRARSTLRRLVPRLYARGGRSRGRRPRGLRPRPRPLARRAGAECERAALGLRGRRLGALRSSF